MLKNFFSLLSNTAYKELNVGSVIKIVWNATQSLHFNSTARVVQYSGVSVSLSPTYSSLRKLGLLTGSSAQQDVGQRDTEMGEKMPSDNRYMYIKNNLTKH